MIFIDRLGITIGCALKVVGPIILKLPYYQEVYLNFINLPHALYDIIYVAILFGPP
jgi:hypothetical protein